MRVTRCGIGIQLARQQNPRQCKTRCWDSDCPTQHAPALPQPPNSLPAAWARLSKRWAAAQGPRRLLQRNIRMFRSTAIFTSAASLVPLRSRLAHLPALAARRPATRVAGTSAAAVGRDARMVVHDVRAASAIILLRCNGERGGGSAGEAVAARLQVAPRIRSEHILSNPVRT